MCKTSRVTEIHYQQLGREPLESIIEGRKWCGNKSLVFFKGESSLACCRNYATYSADKIGILGSSVLDTELEFVGCKTPFWSVCLHCFHRVSPTDESKHAWYELKSTFFQICNHQQFSLKPYILSVSLTFRLGQNCWVLVRCISCMLIFVERCLGSCYLTGCGQVLKTPEASFYDPHSLLVLIFSDNILSLQYWTISWSFEGIRCQL